MAAAFAALRAEIDDPVGRLDDIEMMLDHQDGVALVHQLVQYIEQPPYILNGSSAVIWQLIDGERDLDALVRGVADFYEVAVVTVEQAVVAFVAELGGRGLVVRA